MSNNEIDGISGPCCGPGSGQSNCCDPKRDLPKKMKIMVSIFVILAAIAVGAHSFVKVTWDKPITNEAERSFASGFSGLQASSNSSEIPRGKSKVVPLNLTINSIQELDSLAADKDAVFIVLPMKSENQSFQVPSQLGVVANNLYGAGQKIGVFTLKPDNPDYLQLVRHFSIQTFPGVAILSKHGGASSVSGDFDEGRLYNAFVEASKPVSCCPAQNNSSCCPK